MLASGIDTASDTILSFFVSPSITFKEVLGTNSLIRLSHTGSYTPQSTYAFTNSSLGIDAHFSHQAEARVAFGRLIGDNLLKFGFDASVRDKEAIDYSINRVSVAGSEFEDTVTGRAFIRFERQNQFFELGYDSNGQLSVNASFKLNFYSSRTRG